MKKLVSLFAVLTCVPLVANASELSDAIENTRKECSFSRLVGSFKDVANESMVYSGVGTVAGGVALGTGIAKANVNKKIKENSGVPEEVIEPQNVSTEVVTGESDNVNNPIQETEIADNNAEDTEISDADKMAKKAKTLGLVQGGALFASVLSNAAAAGGATANAEDEPLGWHIDACVAATKELSNVKMTARVAGTADEDELARADKIISACSQWETFDYSKMKKRAKGAAVSSGVAAGAGVVGGSFAIVDSFGESVDDDKLVPKGQKIANISSGVTTGASGVAVGFNAAQLKILKRGVEIAEECEAAFE